MLVTMSLMMMLAAPADLYLGCPRAEVKDGGLVVLLLLVFEEAFWHQMLEMVEFQISEEIFEEFPEVEKHRFVPESGLTNSLFHLD